MAEGQGAEKLSVPFATKEKAVQEFKEKENGKKPDSYAKPEADLIEEKTLDKETDKITADITEAAKVLAPQYAGKLTAKLNSVVAGEKAKLNQKLASINKDSEAKLITLHAEAVAKLSMFKNIPEVAQIYELVEKKDKIAAISEMRLSTYASGSGYHKLIDAKFDALGFNEPKRQAMQKILGVKFDGKVGPETINALSAMLGLGIKKIDSGKKTILADGKIEVDAQGKVIEPLKAEQPEAEPIAGDKTKPAPEEEEKPPEQPKGKSVETVFAEAKGIFALADSTGSAYEFFSFGGEMKGNKVTLDVSIDGKTTSFCSLEVDAMAGTIKFADGAEVPQDKIYDSIKQRLDQHIMPQNLYEISGEKNRDLKVKLPGEMQLHQYGMWKITQKPMKFDINWVNGSLVLHFQEKSEPVANVGKVIISKIGTSVEQNSDSKILLSVNSGQIVVNDKLEEPKPDEPTKPVATDEPKLEPGDPVPEKPADEEPKVAGRSLNLNRKSQAVKRKL